MVTEPNCNIVYYAKIKLHQGPTRVTTAVECLGGGLLAVVRRRLLCVLTDVCFVCRWFAEAESCLCGQGSLLLAALSRSLLAALSSHLLALAVFLDAS